MEAYFDAVNDRETSIKDALASAEAARNEMEEFTIGQSAHS